MGVITAIETSDGAGVKIYRSIGGSETAEDFDPLLMLDEFCSENPDDYIKGFPEHPHCGFQTLTYMLNGSMYHNDNLRNSGKLESGDVQWMTAGSGIIHSEMPAQESGLMRGFQLWINLPAEEKYCRPKYTDIKRTNIPIIKDENTTTKVIAGCYKNTQGPIASGTTNLDFFDIKQSKGAQTLNLDKDKKHFIYVYEGELKMRDMILRERQGTQIAKVVFMECEKLTRFLLISGIPLKEPIARYGPFVMNTKLQIFEAIEKYKNGQFGS